MQVWVDHEPDPPKRPLLGLAMMVFSAIIVLAIIGVAIVSCT